MSISNNCEQNILYLIYKNSSNPLSPSHYNILYIISSLGELDLSSLSKIYEKTSVHNDITFNDSKVSDSKISDTKINDNRNSDNKTFGPFYDLKEIKTFTLEILKKFELDCGYMMSVQEYNSSIEKINEIKDSLDIFTNYGQKVSLEEDGGSTGKLFKKIFKG
ncbi:MAG: hypothetical protein HQK49_01110 [Oligoflexia bacterium]|nr:hypothetical protein [Oligoflexia bacterium]